MIYKLRLQNFRNLPDAVFEFSDKTTVIIGPNASGKTNLLEAIYVTSMGKSFKANLESDLVKTTYGFARVKSLIDDDIKIEVIIERNKSKKFQVNGVGRRMVDFAGNLKVVLFGPWDMDLVMGSPSLRRKFLDGVLSQVDREYRRSILSYEKGLRQRNKLLFRIREEGLPRNLLLFWDQLLVKSGDYVSRAREELIDFINNQPEAINHYSLQYDKSAISEARLAQYAREEIAAGTTLVGPHRDDFIFLERKRDLASFGSRGEQRMAVLWLKLAELSFIENKSGVKPTLLLDDIFSELDEEHREVVFGVVKNQQTIITTADPDFVVDMKEIERIKLPL